MIDRIEGTLVHKSGTALYLETGPFTLQVQVPLPTSEAVGVEATRVKLWAHLQWKEDGPTLFGFASLEERSLFRMLIQVQGVGPRIALSILAHLPPRELVHRLRQRSEAVFTQVPGVGRKTAGRILVELGPQADKMEVEAALTGGEMEPKSEDVEGESISALTALGYAARDARRAVARVRSEHADLPLEEEIRLALRALTSGSRGERSAPH